MFKNKIINKINLLFKTKINNFNNYFYNRNIINSKLI